MEPRTCFPCNEATLARECLCLDRVAPDIPRSLNCTRVWLDGNGHCFWSRGWEVLRSYLGRVTRHSDGFVLDVFRVNDLVLLSNKPSPRPPYTITFIVHPYCHVSLEHKSVCVTVTVILCSCILEPLNIWWNLLSGKNSIQGRDS